MIGPLVSPGTQVPRGSLLMGGPARVKRQVTEKDLELIYRSAKSYMALAAEYRAARDI
jgi:carbonic anhydrase/acetyltransferase-like protein (isoleucine patch superfamily)